MSGIVRRDRAVATVDGVPPERRPRKRDGTVATTSDVAAQRPTPVGRPREGDEAAEWRALQDTLTSVVVQLARLRQQVVQLGVGRSGSVSEPGRDAAICGRLLREIDAVELLARSAQERASKPG